MTERPRLRWPEIERIRTSQANRIANGQPVDPKAARRMDRLLAELAAAGDLEAAVQRSINEVTRLLENGEITRCEAFARVMESIAEHVKKADKTKVDFLSLAWGYLKTVWNAVTPTQVNGNEAVWLGSPHLIEWVDRSGVSHQDQPRLAGPTLVWVEPGPAGEVTYRLEGPPTLGEAIAVAQSVR